MGLVIILIPVMTVRFYLQRNLYHLGKELLSGPLQARNGNIFFEMAYFRYCIRCS